MKKLIVFVIVFFMATTGHASDLQKILNQVTMGGNSSINVKTDVVKDQLDSYWSMTSGTISVIAQEAGFTPHNIIGIYDINNPMNKVEIFKGKSVESQIEIKSNGEVWVNGYYTRTIFKDKIFGFYIDSSYYKQGGVWYSDTRLNKDKADHMLAYQGNGDRIRINNKLKLWSRNSYILAFEDLTASASDFDYTDFVVFIENIKTEYLQVPTSRKQYNYLPIFAATFNSNPSMAKPFGVGFLNFHVKLLPFSSPVDIYLVLYAPHISRHVIYVKPDNSFTHSIVKWKSNNTSLINESLYGNLPFSALPRGSYHWYVFVSDVKNMNNFYSWGSSLVLE